MDSEISGKPLDTQQEKKATQDAMPIVTSEAYESWKRKKGKSVENPLDKAEKGQSSKSRNLPLMALVVCPVIIVALLVLNLSTTADGQRTTYFHILKGKLSFQAVKKDLPTLIKEKGPSVVSIYGFNSGQQMSVLGSGFFISEDGAVITNHHVLKNVSQAIVRTKSEQDYQVTGILAVDKINDLMLISVDIPKALVKPLVFHSGQISEGEDIVVIGNPIGLENTVTRGIVSAIRDDKIQIDAAVSPGSSGGPVLNRKGEVVGVVVSTVLNAQNLNFCVPASLAAKLKPNGLLSLAENAEQNKNDREFAKQENNPGQQRPTAPPPVRDTSPVFCCLDQNGATRFTSDSAELNRMPGGACTQVSGPDGAIKVSKFESWVFGKIGGNPYTTDPVREARQEIDKYLPQIFERFFGGRYVWGNATLTPHEARAWETYIAQVYRNMEAQKLSDKGTNVNRHKYIMSTLKTYCGASSRCVY